MKIDRSLFFGLLVRPYNQPSSIAVVGHYYEDNIENYSILINLKKSCMYSFCSFEIYINVAFMLVVSFVSNSIIQR